MPAKDSLAAVLEEIAQKLEGLATNRFEALEITLVMCARRLRVAILLGAHLDRPTSSPKP
jgi:hypothetical protein